MIEKALIESPRLKHGAFSNLLAKRMVRTAACMDRDYWRRLSLVAMVLDNRILEEIHDSSHTPKFQYAVISRREHVRVLYTATAHSVQHAFYIMCADACDQEHYKDRPGDDVVSRIDPQYRTLDIEALLDDVGSRAEWKVPNLWDAFCSFRHETHPWEIVPATSDHYKLSDFVAYN
jgi:hypothetical protein